MSINGTNEAARLVCTGYVNGVPIMTDVTHVEAGYSIFVTLGGNAYILAFPPGYPFVRPQFMGAGAAAVAAQTIAPGARVLMLKIEADALVAAGAASYS